MDYLAFLGRIVDDGIEAARRDYGPGQKLDGSVAGFEACRYRRPEQLATVLAGARRDTETAYLDTATGLGERVGKYWYWRCRELEIEWVCNVVSVALMNQELLPIVPPTGRAAEKAAEILGVAG